MMSGWIAFATLVSIVVLALGGLVYQAPQLSPAALLSDGEVLRIIRFTLWQAMLSTVISVGLAIPFARALNRRPQFKGRRLLIRVCSLSLVIPTMVAVFGIAAVHGRSGWANQLLHTLGFEQGYSLYGLNGILIAHVFFNMPLATRVFLNALESLPGETWRLSSQLGLSSFSIFKLIEWPLLRSVIPGIAGLIFMLCFTSFAIVLSLGGGPASSTLEVAIYQAIRFDYDIARAVLLAFIQVIICLSLVSLFSSTRKEFSFQTHHQNLYPRPDARSWHSRLFDGLFIFIISCFILSPLLAIVVRAVSPAFTDVIISPAFSSALFSSVFIALSAAMLSLLISLPIAFLYKNLGQRAAKKRRALLDAGSALILVVPPLTLGMGLFLVFRSFSSMMQMGVYLVILINAMLAVPFVLRILQPAIIAGAQQVDRLSISLGIQGWALLRHVYWPHIRPSLALAMALATTLSLGDMGVIALFGTQDLSTLPLLIYRLFGAYRMDEAAVVSFLLLALCFILFWSIERIIGGRQQHA